MKAQGLKLIYAMACGLTLPAWRHPKRTHMADIHNLKTLRERGGGKEKRGLYRRKGAGRGEGGGVEVGGRS